MSQANEPAFATPPKVITELDQDPYLVRGQVGLTKRELFAAMAMQGLLSQGGYDKWDYVATDAVNVADALIAALNKPVTSAH